MSDEPKATSARSSMPGPRKLIVFSALLIAVALLGFVFIRNLIDFPVYYAAGRSLLSGRTDLYAPDFALGQVMDYRYPPFFLLALAPLWVLPYSGAAYVWYLLSVLEIIGCVLIISRTFPALRESKRSRTFPALRGSKRMWLLVALAVGQYFVMALHYGNAHLLVTFLMFASLYLVFRRKREIVAAGSMALAITIKLTPILLIPYFALRRKWKVLGAIFVFVVAVNLIPAGHFGFKGNNEQLVNWYKHVVASQEFHEDNGPINLSLKGQLRRYLTTIDYSQRVDGDVQYPAVNFASLSREAIDLIWMVLAAGLFAATLLLLWWATRLEAEFDGDIAPDRSVQNPRSRILPIQIGIMICVVLLVGPLTSKIYFVALLWPVACLADFAGSASARGTKLAIRVLVFLAVINSVLPLLPGRSIQRLLLVLGVDFFVNCLVMTALICVLLSRLRELRTQAAELQTQSRSEARTT